MSHSRKKHPITGCCGTSEKRDKQAFNRGFRNELKCRMRKGWFDSLPKRRNPRNGGNWSFIKDGKRWVDEEEAKEFPQLIRK